MTEQDQEDFESCAALSHSATQLAIASALPDPEEGEKSILVTDAIAAGIMAGLVATLTGWTVSSAMGVEMPLDQAKKRLIDMIEDHWDQVVLNLCEGHETRQ